MATKRITLDARNPQTEEFNDTLTWSKLDKLSMDFLRQNDKIKNFLRLRPGLMSVQTSVSSETKTYSRLSRELYLPGKTLFRTLQWGSKQRVCLTLHAILIIFFPTNLLGKHSPVYIQIAYKHDDINKVKDNSLHKR